MDKPSSFLVTLSATGEPTRGHCIDSLRLLPGVEKVIQARMPGILLIVLMPNVRMDAMQALLASAVNVQGAIPGCIANEQVLLRITSNEHAPAIRTHVMALEPAISFERVFPKLDASDGPLDRLWAVRVRADDARLVVKALHGVPGIEHIDIPPKRGVKPIRRARE